MGAGKDKSGRGTNTGGPGLGINGSTWENGDDGSCNELKPDCKMLDSPNNGDCVGWNCCGCP